MTAHWAGECQPKSTVRTGTGASSLAHPPLPTARDPGEGEGQLLGFGNSSVATCQQKCLPRPGGVSSLNAEIPERQLLRKCQRVKGRRRSGCQRGRLRHRKPRCAGGHQVCRCAWHKPKGHNHRLTSFLRSRELRLPSCTGSSGQGRWAGAGTLHTCSAWTQCLLHPTIQESELSLELKVVVGQTCRGHFPGSPSGWHCHTWLILSTLSLRWTAPQRAQS